MELVKNEENEREKRKREMERDFSPCREREKQKRQNLPQSLTKWLANQQLSYQQLEELFFLPFLVHCWIVLCVRVVFLFKTKHQVKFAMGSKKKWNTQNERRYLVVTSVLLKCITRHIFVLTSFLFLFDFWLKQQQNNSFFFILILGRYFLNEEKGKKRLWWIQKRVWTEQWNSID